MECKGKSRLINLYMDNMLPKETQVALEKHMDTCSVCKETLSSYTIMRDMMRHVYRDDPINVKPRVLRTIIFPRKIMKGVFTAAAMLLLVIGGYFMGSYRPLKNDATVVQHHENSLLEDSAQISSNTSETVKVRYENVSF